MEIGENGRGSSESRRGLTRFELEGWDGREEEGDGGEALGEVGSPGSRIRSTGSNLAS